MARAKDIAMEEVPVPERTMKRKGKRKGRRSGKRSSRY